MEDSIPRGQLAPGEDSWHLKAYRWGMKHGKAKKPGYRENLCHYMRVILIWVPIFWFFKAPIRKKGILSYVRPWEVVFVPACLAGTVYVVYKLWTIVDWDHFWHEFWMIFRHPSLSALAVTFLIMAAAFLVVFQREVERFFQRNIKHLEFLLLIVAPFYWLFLAVKRLAIFVFRPRFYYLGVWTVLLLTSAVGFTWIWTDEAVYLGKWAVAIALATILVIAAVIGVVVLVWFLFDDQHVDLGWRISQAYNNSEAPRVVKKKGTSFFRMLWHFVRAKKYKICPFIILPEDRVQMADSED